MIIENPTIAELANRVIALHMSQGSPGFVLRAPDAPWDVCFLQPGWGNMADRFAYHLAVQARA